MKYFIDPRYNSFVIIISVMLAFTTTPHQSPLVVWASWIILLYFLLEACFKIRIHGGAGYFASHLNKFDFFLVVVSLAFVALPSVEIGSVAFLRIYRVMSLIKIIRLMPDGEHVVKGLIRAIKAAKAILMFLAIQLVFFSLLGHTLFAGHLPEFFGSPFTSMNTVFTIFTVENWEAVPEAAKALNNKSLYYVVNTFVISVLIFGGFIALSLANAIFVDEMASDNNDELKEKIEQLSRENAEIKQLIIALQGSTDDSKKDVA